MAKMIVLTPRDYDILFDCYENIQLSFSHLRQTYFSGKVRWAAGKRLTKLVSWGLLASHDVGACAFGSKERVHRLYTITKLGIKELSRMRPEFECRSMTPSLKAAQLSHDLLLTKVVVELRKKHPGKRVTLPHLLPIYGQKLVPLPDAVMLDESGQIDTAIELELSRKSTRRYRDIIESYDNSIYFPSVLYIVGSDFLANNIKRIIAPQIGSQIPKDLHTGKFQFMRVSELVSEANGRGDQCYSE